MATITSNSSGNWATGSTWVGGSVPAADDLVVIAHGHKVTLNTNIQSTRTGDVTIDGNLHFATNGKMHLHGRMTVHNTSNSNTGGTQYWTSPGGGIVDDNKYWALALDCDNNKLYVRLEGTWLESADPSAGTGGYAISDPDSVIWGCYRFANGIYFGNTNTFKWNFGNGFFGTTSAGATNADSDGYGVFKYSVPTGFKALCTAQLATYG